MKVKDPNETQIEVGKVSLQIQKPEYKKTQVISDKIAELLLKQVAREMFNHNLYATFCDYFKIIGLDPLAEYFKSRAKEEMNHHSWITEYLSDCSIPFAYPQIDAIEMEIPNHLFPFQKTVDAEIETTEWIKKIADIVFEEKDWQTFFWIRKLVDEQVEEEGLSLKVLQLASQETDWITKSEAILNFYKN
jgi:ferritin